jgi:deoxyribodipyrimidine photo-lyase
LHFGQISPIYIALQARRAAAHDEDRASYLEELVVRRELAHNFVHYTEGYDRYTGLPGWARATLDDHRDDERPRTYTAAQLDAAETHDSYWNAATREMKHSGYLHNHMRMYWGKKILEWSPAPENAYRVALELNNRYFLDGRDPASYANVGWIFGLHDRPWPGRAVYGTVRSMSAGGLERKADMSAYVERVDEIVRKGDVQ